MRTKVVQNVMVSIDGSTPRPGTLESYVTEQSAKERHSVVQDYVNEMLGEAGNSEQFMRLLQNQVGSALKPYLGAAKELAKGMTAIGNAARAAGVTAAELQKQMDSLTLNHATGEELDKLMKARGDG
jgi:hypothetical protein